MALEGSVGVVVDPFDADGRPIVAIPGAYTAIRARAGAVYRGPETSEEEEEQFR